MLDVVRRRYHYGRYQKVKQLIGESDRKRVLLDIGCGKPCDSMEDGSFVKYIGYGVGMDIKDCSKEFNFIRASVLDIPFKEKAFDVVTAMEVIEHIDDLDRALKEINSLLTDDGIFIMSVPNNGLLWKIFWFFWTRTVGRMWIHQHKIEYNKEQWIRILNRYFQIIELREHWLVDVIFKMKRKESD